MIDLQLEKSKIQREALDELIKNNGGLIAIATGGGKSKIAIDYMGYLKEKLGRNPKTLLVVPTEKLRDSNWKKEFEKWNFELYDSIDRYCYVSINKLQNVNYDLVILDEMHNITTNNSKFFFQNSFSSIVALTATPPTEIEKKEIIDSLHIKNVYELSMDDAVQRGVIAPFDIKVYLISPDNKEKYIASGTKQKRFFVTELERYNYLTTQLEMIKEGLSNKSSKFVVLERMRLIYNFKTKLKVAKYLLANIIPLEKRGIIFTGNIKTAEELETQTFHSKSSDKDLTKLINGEINRLSAVDALNEGMDIDNLDFALLLQVKSKERHLIQRIGRIVRYRPNHRATIYIVCAKGTVDEDWLSTALENIHESNIQYFNVNIK